MHERLDEAARAARDLVTQVTVIQGITAQVVTPGVLDGLMTDLYRACLEAAVAVQAVRPELQRTRNDQGVQLGSIWAPTAHDVALEMARALIGQPPFGMWYIGYRPIREWPDVAAVYDGIEWERSQAGPPSPPPPAATADESSGVVSLTRDQHEILRALGNARPHRKHGYQMAQLTRISPKTCNRVLKELVDLKLVDRPSKRGPAGCTPAGLQVLARAPDLPPKGPQTSR